MIRIEWEKIEKSIGFVKNAKQGVLEFENKNKKQALKSFKLLDKCGYGVNMYRKD